MDLLTISSWSLPANTYLFKFNYKKLAKGGKYVQSLQKKYLVSFFFFKCNLTISRLTSLPFSTFLEVFRTFPTQKLFQASF